MNMQAEKRNIPRARLKRAVCLVVGLLLVLVFCQMAQRFAQATVLQEVVHPSTTSADAQTEIPASFEQEVISLADKSEVSSNAHVGMVGFTLHTSADQALKTLRSTLEDRGWRESGSGSDTCATFLKTSGEYRWLYVSCISVASHTSVVLQTGAPFKQEEGE